MPTNKRRINDNHNGDPGENGQNSENGMRNSINVDVNVNVNTNIGDAPCQEDGVTGYPPVSIVNSTPFDARGVVEYASFLCSDDRYNVSGNGGRWDGPGRGACLLTRITAIIRTPIGDVNAVPYTSSGTSYSQFAIIRTGEYLFEVTRRTELE